MKQQEFTQRTGFAPTAAQFDVINAEYMATDIDKDTFCKEWKRKGGILECSKANAVTVSELERKLQMVYSALDEYIFKHNDKLDTLNDQYDRRGYFYELYKEIKAIKEM